jgi:hypothetical protein
MTTNSKFQPQPVDEAAISAALEHRAATEVPADFASRVIAALPPQRIGRTKPIGRTVALLAAALLTVALFALAPHTVANFANLAFDLELLLLAQLCGIAWLLTPRSGE